MKLCLLSLLLITPLFVDCRSSASRAPTSFGPSQHLKLPEFEDDPVYGVNEDIMAPRQKLIFYRNYDAIKEILKHDPVVVREEMGRRLEASQPISLRLLAAAVLVLKNDDLGKQFFLAHAKTMDDLGDLYVTLKSLAWSSEWLTGSAGDLSWAEDLMIEALQNRTPLDRKNALHFRQNIHWSEAKIEVRELAVTYGEFADLLARMRSEKGLPVIISLIKEYPYYRLNTAIGYLGSYKDDRVGPLLLDILKRYEDSKHKDSYRFAASAAAEMGLKSAVPMLLRHLDDEDSYEGLRVLADAGAIPKIKAALPRLKSYARAEAELTVIYLQGGDLVPPLLQLLKRRDYLKRNDVIMKLEELHDSRSVQMVSTALCHDPDWFVRHGSIRVLAAVKTKEAIAGLVNGLDCDYSKLNRGKTAPDHDYNREYRDEIATALKQLTGRDFGTDKKQWMIWLGQQKEF
jgi:HEAT repeat protein